MQILQGSRYLGGVEASVFLGDALPRASLQSAEKLATTAVFHAEVQVVLGLERMVQGDDERVVAGGENFLLGEGSLDLVPLDHLLLAQDYGMGQYRIRAVLWRAQQTYPS